MDAIEANAVVIAHNGVRLGIVCDNALEFDLQCDEEKLFFYALSKILDRAE